MKTYFRLIILLTILVGIFSGCGVSFKSRSDKIKQEQWVVHAQGCAPTSEAAKQVALTTLSQEQGIEEQSILSQAIYVVVDAKKICYEAGLEAKMYDLHITSLRAKRQALEQKIVDDNGTIAFEDKDTYLNSIIQEAQAINVQIEKVTLVKASSIEPLAVSRSQLSQRFNAKPSLSFKIKACNYKSNYRCRVSYFSQTSDESEKLEYRWDFGDGEHSSYINPLHTFKGVGTYKVTLEVSDEHNVSNRFSKVVSVSKPNKPKAYFILKKPAYEVGEVVHFINRSKSSKDKISRYHWSFGDGTHATKRQPSHRYKKSGKYLVKLTTCTTQEVCAAASTWVVIKEVVQIDAVIGERYSDFKSRNQEPDETIFKKRAPLNAYRYGDIWLLVKRGKVACAVRKEGLKRSLMGAPKQCYWHEKHMPDMMVPLKR